MDTEAERARWRYTANHRVHRRLQLGLEFNAEVEEVNPLLTLFLLTETERRPALFLGTSSDRVGSPSGETAYYATLSKYLPVLGTALNATLNYSEWDEAVNLPFGVSVDLGRGGVARYMYDGERSHGLLDLHVTERLGVSLLAVWFERFGVSLFGGF